MESFHGKCKLLLRISSSVCDFADSAVSLVKLLTYFMHMCSMQNCRQTCLNKGEECQFCGRGNTFVVVLNADFQLK